MLQGKFKNFVPSPFVTDQWWVTSFYVTPAQQFMTLKGQNIDRIEGFVFSLS